MFTKVKTPGRNPPEASRKPRQSTALFNRHWGLEKKRLNKEGTQGTHSRTRALLGPQKGSQVLWIANFTESH